MFQLDEEIEKWCKTLGIEGQDRDSNIEELKHHLYSEVKKQQVLGLSEQDAFHAAISKLGKPGELKKEFAKTATNTDNTAYRSAVGVAFAAAFILVWKALALGIPGVADDLADLMYIGVFAVGIIGATIARLQPNGMARAMFATAFAQVLVTIFPMITRVQGAMIGSVIENFRLSWIFVVLCFGSSWLFRSAAREERPTGTETEG